MRPGWCLVQQLVGAVAVVGCVDSGIVGETCGESCARCHPQTLTCVECLASADCTGSDRPYCDPQRFVCVQCLTNVECADAGTVCNLGQCETCLAAALCQGDPLCVAAICGTLVPDAGWPDAGWLDAGWPDGSG
jgi:hypothetical protein